jgi:hypothetical protein
MHATAQEQGRGGVPEIVESDIGSLVRLSGLNECAWRVSMCTIELVVPVKTNPELRGERGGVSVEKRVHYVSRTEESVEHHGS